MLLRQIKYFCTIVEEGSFTEAAEKCFISQSAISQQIQSLEKELGVKLIKRENRRFSLTHAGEYMYRHGTALLLEAERICKEVKRIGRDEYESCYVFFYCGLRNANRTCRLYRYKWRVIIKKSISTSVDSNMANVHDLGG